MHTTCVDNASGIDQFDRVFHLTIYEKDEESVPPELRENPASVIGIVQMHLCGEVRCTTVQSGEAKEYS